MWPTIGYQNERVFSPSQDLWWGLSLWALRLSSFSNRRLMNVFLGWTTWLAQDRWPINEASSFCIQRSLASQWRSIPCSSDSLVAGSLISKDCESTSNPKNVKHVEGPSNFFSAIGRPSWRKVEVSMSKSDEFGMESSPGSHPGCELGN